MLLKKKTKMNDIMKKDTQIYSGDAKDILKSIKSDSIDLIFTSPPYADSRKNTYGGIHPDKYVDWFLPISEELRRVLKSSGTFVLNIKEKVVDGERHTYVMNLIIEMRKQGWFWTEEFIWHKKNSYPGKWPNRFRDSWERLIQFNKSKQFNMYQEEVMVPVGDWAKSRLKNLSETDKKRDNAKTKSGFGKNVSNWLNRDKVYPTNVLQIAAKDIINLDEYMEYPSNVLHLSTECNNKNHSAAFPDELPEWFIKLFTKEDDTVLDPFMGSGTTILVAKKMGRKAIGIDILPEYFEMVDKLLNPEQLHIFEKKVNYGKSRSKGSRKLR